MLAKLRRAMIAGQNEGEVREERFAGKIKKSSAAQVSAQVSPNFPLFSGFSWRVPRAKPTACPCFCFSWLWNYVFFRFARMDLTKLNPPPS